MRNEYHLADQPIPTGHQIFEERLSIAGIQYYKNEAISFCRSSDKSLYFERDFANAHDKNAMHVYGRWRGLWGTKAKPIGYIQADIAQRLSSLGIADKVSARLLRTYVGDDDYVDILYQIIGPSEYFRPYKPTLVSAIDESKTLAAEGDIDRAIQVLLDDIGKQESEEMLTGYGVAGRSYKALADIFKKTGRLEDEYLILERFMTRRRARGATQDKLAERFLKTRIARDKRIASGK